MSDSSQSTQSTSIKGVTSDDSKSSSEDEKKVSKRLAHPDNYPKDCSTVCDDTDAYKISAKLSRDNPFHPTAMGTQILWRATDSCDASQVKKLIYWINKIGKAGSKNFSIHINTGTHGDGKGNTIHDMPLSQKHAEIKFSEEDLSNVLHLNNVSLHTITTTTPPQYPRAAAHVIDAWCSSSNNGDAQEYRTGTWYYFHPGWGGYDKQIDELSIRKIDKNLVMQIQFNIFPVKLLTPRRINDEEIAKISKDTHKPENSPPIDFAPVVSNSTSIDSSMGIHKGSKQDNNQRTKEKSPDRKVSSRRKSSTSSTTSKYLNPENTESANSLSLTSVNQTSILNISAESMQGDRKSHHSFTFMPLGYVIYEEVQAAQSNGVARQWISLENLRNAPLFS